MKSDGNEMVINMNIIIMMEKGNDLGSDWQW